MDPYLQVKTREFHPVPSRSFSYFSCYIVFKFNFFDNLVSLSTRPDAEIPSSWLQAMLAYKLLSTTRWRVNESVDLLAERVLHKHRQG